MMMCLESWLGARKPRHVAVSLTKVRAGYVTEPNPRLDTSAATIDIILSFQAQQTHTQNTRPS